MEISLKNILNKTINGEHSAAPLVLFRFILGLMLLLGFIRFWYNGWIEDLYIKPLYYFPFYGFEFVKPLSAITTYALFFLTALSALFVALGLFYRISSIVLFLGFTYIELIDKSTYLNHYYFISLICFLMMFLPANVNFSIDAMINKNIVRNKIPAWTINSIKLMVGILYFFAGVAKLNIDWLFHAQPLTIWLPARNDMPLIGWLFNYQLTAYVFSWIGCIYDLLIPFILINNRFRIYGYLTVIIFHFLTSALFPIGMFPYIMVVTALIFFSPETHIKIMHFFSKLLKIKWIEVQESIAYNLIFQRIIQVLFLLFFIVQIILPFRYLAYPGRLFWTEQGFRFSWRVMLIEKAGLAEFKIVSEDGKRALVNNRDFLTPLQEKMMSTQPDMILQFAKILKNHYSKIGYNNPKVYVDSYVTLNGALGKAMIDPNVDLGNEKEGFEHKSWIINIK